ncbi:MAG: glycosyltransferase [Flavobacteriaceae bacterium]|nr:glycosyltransferase [Flavobacteriaceae bacterium]
MTFTLIICTYMRPEVLLKLLKSVEAQLVYPDEILIIDGSTDNKTKKILAAHTFKKLKYLKVSKDARGLVKQRNVGIAKVSKNIDIVCFLDDDIVLTPDYFKHLTHTYKLYPEAIGVGGYITNEVYWQRIPKDYKIAQDDFEMDGYVRKMGQRFLLRKKMGLLPNKPPCIMPEFSHGYSVGFLPPTCKIYPAQYFMGGVSSFKKEIFDKIKFSAYFEGYGLYEDLDFCLRASRLGNMYVNTAAQLGHYHAEGGRPNKFNYGKMVVRNGWYVWRVGNPNPSLKARFKWHFITLLLTLIRFSNIFTSINKKEALTEVLGRIIAWCVLLFSKPLIK